MLAKTGAFGFVLHSHLPYVRQAGTWPHGEEMVHEAICDTYVPLLQALCALAEEGCDYRVAIEVTPILAEQLSDPLVIADYRVYMAALIDRVDEAERHYTRQGDASLASLARYYAEWNRQIVAAFEHQFQADLLGVLRRLQDAGLVELVAGAGTHPFLPLMSRDSTARAHIGLGVREYVRRFGRQPRCMWLPECGYRPPEYDMSHGHAVFRPGLETFLDEVGIRGFFADSSAVEGGEVAIIPARASSYREEVARAGLPRTRRLPAHNTAWPYLVGQSNVAVFARDRLTGGQVWSASEGYPGHFAYREFHKKDAICGMRFWKITGNGVALGEKEHYDPIAAFGGVAAQADHFVRLLEAHVAGNAGLVAEPPPMILSPYDTELFGHWWFEGVEWLKQVLRRLAVHPTIELTTPGDYLERYPPEESIALPQSSWGAGADTRTWFNDATSWMWPIVHGYELQMEDMIRRFPAASGAMEAALNQAARELLLVESSDWPFLVSTGQADAYASLRFRTHAARFDSLVDQLLSERIQEEELGRAAALDNPFLTLDYHLFAGQPEPAPPVQSPFSPRTSVPSLPAARSN
ncbi:MAG: 1,4-alpha-glucan branching protein domain-containing protein [Chloroflexota bacterium]